LIVVTAFLTACAANPARVEAPAQAAADKLAPPAKPLSSFAKYELKPMVFDSAIEESEGKLKKAQELEQSLNQRLMPLLNRWRGASDKGSSGTLSIETQLINLRIIGGGTRFFTPTVVVGDSRINMDLQLINTTTGDEIASVQIRASARRWGSAYTGIGDETLDDYVVAIVYDYLSGNY